ncbi:hypothetical protein ACFY71_13275 [Streptomyces cinerochromogenes]
MLTGTGVGPQQFLGSFVVLGRSPLGEESRKPLLNGGLAWASRVSRAA